MSTHEHIQGFCIDTCVSIQTKTSWYRPRQNFQPLPILLTWLFLVGMVVFLSMSLVNTPPSVSMPRESGVTSKRTTSVTSPARTPPWMAAPIATASSGLTERLGVRPKIFWTVSWTWNKKKKNTFINDSFITFEWGQTRLKHWVWIPEHLL